MPNIFQALAVPAADGVGAWSNVSSMGKDKTFTISGAFTGTVTIEVSNDAGTGFAPLASFTQNKKKSIKVACSYMRVRRSGVVGGATPEVNVAASDDGVQTANLPVSAGDGVGAAVETDQFGSFWTAIIDAAFTGTVTIEISDDTNNWEPLMSFSQSGVLKSVAGVIAAYVRVRRSGVGAVPGTPNVDLAAVNDDESLLNLFGNGEDGDEELTGDLVLDRDYFYNSLDTAGYDIDTAGFRLFVKNKFTISGDSVVGRAGNDAIADAGGLALAAGSLGGSVAGGAGATAGGANGTAIAQSLGNDGGDGGLGAGGAGGTGGVATAPTAAESVPSALPGMFSGYTLDGTIYKGGAGGAGGGGDGAADEGGGGGGGGGVVMIAAREIVVAETTGVIQSIGGDGAAGTATNCGGGGGGGGGALILIYRKLDNQGTISTDGGAGGASGGGTGVAGDAGVSGLFYDNQV